MGAFIDNKEGVVSCFINFEDVLLVNPNEKPGHVEVRRVEKSTIMTLATGYGRYGRRSLKCLLLSIPFNWGKLFVEKVDKYDTDCKYGTDEVSFNTKGREAVKVYSRKDTFFVKDENFLFATYKAKIRNVSGLRFKKGLKFRHIEGRHVTFFGIVSRLGNGFRKVEMEHEDSKVVVELDRLASFSSSLSLKANKCSKGEKQTVTLEGSGIYYEECDKELSEYSELDEFSKSEDLLKQKSTTLYYFEHGHPYAGYTKEEIEEKFRAYDNVGGMIDSQY